MSLVEIGASSLRAIAESSNAWPFDEARKIVARLQRAPKAEVIFETGYGPSGLPHIGTFGEVARTTMVRHAFRVLTEDKVPTRLICFSDDMDGLRKIPDNVPNREMLEEDRDKPVTSVSDPFGEYESFGAHNNARLRAFLDSFGFEYEFVSSTDCYRGGRFDATLLTALERWPQSGVPENPGAWLMATAKNRAIDLMRRGATLERFMNWPVWKVSSRTVLALLKTGSER